MATSNGTPGEPAGDPQSGGQRHQHSAHRKTVEVPGASTRVGGETTVNGSDVRSAPAERTDVGGTRATVHAESEVHTESATPAKPMHAEPPG